MKRRLELKTTYAMPLLDVLWILLLALDFRAFSSCYFG